MITRTAQGYFFDGKPLTQILEGEEAQTLERIMDTLEGMSDEAHSILNEYSYDTCLKRGVIIPEDEYHSRSA